MLGTILIPVGLLILINNERKVVNYLKVINEARDECRTIQVYQPEDENEFKLVHAAGVTKAAHTIGDQAFGA